MSSVRIAASNDQLAEEARAFAVSIEDAKARWLYCLSRVRRIETYRGREQVSYSDAAIKICSRILGARIHASRYRFQRLDEMGYEAANVSRAVSILPPPYSVGPLEAWHIGHVYFARIESHPHVVKIGFSRRVRARLDDIASESRSNLIIQPKHLKVGTMADERWWHDNWKKTRIDGEWFFDPHSTDRTLPAFLEKAEAA